jgi:hypothetical protein
MTYQPGQSGNPAGRAVGSRNKKTIAMEEAFFAQADALVQNVVKRAMAGEPAAMRLCMERVLPVGRGRPLPIDLPTVRSADDAQAAAAVITGALKQGAISAREAVDLLRVVEGLTRLAGAVEIVRKIARAEVAKAAAALGLEHFYAGPPAERRADDAGQRAEERDWRVEENARSEDEDVFPGRAAARSDAAQTRGPGAAHVDPGWPPDQRCTASRCTASGARPADAGAANGGVALVNIRENTSAARNGDAAGRGHNGAKPPE